MKKRTKNDSNTVVELNKEQLEDLIKEKFAQIFSLNTPIKVHFEISMGYQEKFNYVMPDIARVQVTGKLKGSEVTVY